MGEVISLKWRQRKKMHDELDEQNKRERRLENFIKDVMDLYYTHFKEQYRGHETDIPDVIFTARMIDDMGIDGYLIEQCKHYGFMDESY